LGTGGSKKEFIRRIITGDFRIGLKARISMKQDELFLFSIKK
jgi:hypothetical protein